MEFSKDTISVASKPIIKGIDVLSEYMYLVRNNGEIVGYVEDEAKGILMVNSLAALEMKKPVNPFLKILRQEFNGGKEVHVCTQSLGKFWDGRVKKTAVIDIIPVVKIQLSRQ